MAAKGKKSPKAGARNKSRPKMRQPSRSRATGPVNRVLSDPRAASWERLLRDPCNAQLASPCYGGADTGYLIRTVDTFTPTGGGTGLVAGNILPVDATFQWTPYNLSSTTGLLYAAAQSGAALPAQTAFGFGNFIAGSAVRRYRPVASCIKFIPTGPYSSRRGMIAANYSAGQAFFTGVPNTVSAPNAFNMCQHISSLGSEAHEVRWLPTAVDENFTDTSVGNNTGAGSILFVLREVDGTATSTTTFTINGYLEVITVWEWIPATISSVSISPKAPTPYTTQQVLSTIGDMGAFLYQGLRATGYGVAQASVHEGMRMLTAGYGGSRNRGNPMPTIRY